MSKHNEIDKLIDNYRRSSVNINNVKEYLLPIVEQTGCKPSKSDIKKIVDLYLRMTVKRYGLCLIGVIVEGLAGIRPKCEKQSTLLLRAIFKSAKNEAATKHLLSLIINVLDDYDPWLYRDDLCKIVTDIVFD